MDFREYHLRLMGVQLARVDGQREYVLNKFIDRKMEKTKKRGKEQVYVVQKETDLFDFDRMERGIYGDTPETDPKFERLFDIAYRLREYRKGGGNNGREIHS